MKDTWRLILLLGLLLSTSAARADTILVANFGNGTVGEYTTSGGTVTAALISGVSNPGSITVSGSNLFVANGTPANTIGEYTTSGSTVNASLISGFSGPPHGVGRLARTSLSRPRPAAAAR
jgi:hypothetical protein